MDYFLSASLFPHPLILLVRWPCAVKSVSEAMAVCRCCYNCCSSNAVQWLPTRKSTHLGDGQNCLLVLCCSEKRGQKRNSGSAPPLHHPQYRAIIRYTILYCISTLFCLQKKCLLRIFLYRTYTCPRQVPVVGVGKERCIHTSPW